jgi:hypothetical protein
MLSLFQRLSCLKFWSFLLRFSYFRIYGYIQCLNVWFSGWNHANCSEHISWIWSIEAVGWFLYGKVFTCSSNIFFDAGLDFVASCGLKLERLYVLLKYFDVESFTPTFSASRLSFPTADTHTRISSGIDMAGWGVLRPPRAKHVKTNIQNEKSHFTLKIFKR